VLKTKLISLSLLVLFFTTPFVFAGDESLNKNPIIKKFIDQMVKKDKFDRKTLVAMFEKVKNHSEIINK